MKQSPAKREKGARNYCPDFKRKHAQLFCLLTAIAFLMGINTRAMADPTPILLYEFNDGGSRQAETTSSTGSAGSEATLTLNDQLQGAFSHDGEGVTGQPGDYALDLRSVTAMGRDGVGGGAFVTNPPAEGLKSFSVTGWCKAVVAPCKGARFIDYIGDKYGFLVCFDDDAKLNFQVNGGLIGVKSSELSYNETGVWVFVAVTYDATSNVDNLVFYKGLNGVLKAEKVTIPNAQPSAPCPPNVWLCIGNASGGQRPFKGLLDKIAVYGSDTDSAGALSYDQVKAVFSAVSVPPVTASP